MNVNFSQAVMKAEVAKAGKGNLREDEVMSVQLSNHFPVFCNESLHSIIRLCVKFG